jgi:hypothetical protein
MAPAGLHLCKHGLFAKYSLDKVLLGLQLLEQRLERPQIKLLKLQLGVAAYLEVVKCPFTG